MPEVTAVNEMSPERRAEATKMYASRLRELADRMESDTLPKDEVLLIGKPSESGALLCFVCRPEEYPFGVKMLLDMTPPGLSGLITQEVIVPWVLQMAGVFLPDVSPADLAEAKAQALRAIDLVAAPKSKPQ